MDCNLPTFCKMIRQRAERLPPSFPGILDPYREIDKLVIETRTLEANVLIELVAAMERGGGTFREADIYALDAHALRVADALIEATLMGFDRG